MRRQESFCCRGLSRCEVVLSPVREFSSLDAALFTMLSCMMEQSGLGDIIILGREGCNETVPHPISSLELSGDPFIPPETEDEHAATKKSIEMSKVSKVSFVEAGGMMSCAVDRDGALWMWGHCPSLTNEGSELSFSLSDFSVPQPVAGKHFCYAWGNNRYGQLGLGDRENRVLPQLVQVLAEPNAGSLSEVSCGAYHSAVVTHNETIEEDAPLKRMSMCWTCGMGENGQLGHGDTENLPLPQIVEGLPNNTRIVAISCGLFHMGAVCEAGGVWIWGMENGLGLCPGLGPPGLGGGDYLLPVKVVGNDAFAASYGMGLACGAAHTVFAALHSNNCILWAWGRGESGVLGTGQSTDRLTPSQVVWPPCNTANTDAVDGDVGLRGFDSPLNVTSPESYEMAPVDQMLALAQKEICALTTELSVTKKHYAALHAAVYGPFEPGDGSDTWDALRDWDKKVADSSYNELVRLDEFYRQARARVKEVLLQKKVENYCKEFMNSVKREEKDNIGSG
ncbi:hypothetical protein GOP47_0000638 [Adiantum capillus-veneris]|uniref:Ultraviolet-B receptor UVR8 n=1 Tax=Adiantum capillus-veneris TaxID=13818 RepID=A0A9D4VE96_ADICA|nr:hypothetical protein GOP47_0000638 [Adiantum capillus-veneris]